MGEEWRLRPEEKLEGYTLKKPIGRTRSCEVYLAEHGIWGQVALKLFTDPALDYNTLLEEAWTMANFKGHPHIVGIYDARILGPYPILAMEFMEGKSLRERLNAERFFQPAEAVSLIKHLCYGLRAIHQKGFVHRDVKPENGLFDKRGRLKLGDLGCAVHHQDERTRFLAGTPPYMAPETVTGPHLPQSDIYSLGILLYELLMGKRPYEVFDTDDLKEQLEEGRLEVGWPDELLQPIHPDLKDMVLKATAFDVRDRYQNIDEMLAKLRGYEWGEVPTEFDSDLGLGARPLIGAHSREEGEPGDPLEGLLDETETEMEKEEKRRFLESFKMGREAILRGLKEEMHLAIYSGLQESLDLKNFYLGMEHLVLVLTRKRDGILYRLLTQKGCGPRAVGQRIRDQIQRFENKENRLLSPRLERVLERAREDFPTGVGEREFWVATLREKNFTTLLLEEEGIDREEIQREA